jgi:hypothetical protein
MGRRTIRRSKKIKRKSRVRRSRVKKWGGVYTGPSPIKDSKGNVVQPTATPYYSGSDALKLPTVNLNNIIADVVNASPNGKKADIVLEGTKYEIAILSRSNSDNFLFRFTKIYNDNGVASDVNNADLGEKLDTFLKNGGLFLFPLVKLI